jgi:hypothetical protein
MVPIHHSIFRDEALRRYLASREQSVLPRMISQHTFVYLWFLLGMLVISIFLTYLIRVPPSVSGSRTKIEIGSQQTISLLHMLGKVLEKK